MERRKFIKSGGLALTCTCLAGSTFTGCTMVSGVSKTPAAAEKSYSFSDGIVSLDLSKNEKLNQTGESVKLEISADNKVRKILVAKTDGDEFLAFSNECTHGLREIEYNHQNKIFQCVSFGHSQYDLEGNVVKGPAPEPLQKFRVDVEDSVLSIFI